MTDGLSTNDPSASRIRVRLQREGWGLGLVLLALLFGLVLLSPELSIGALPPNDVSLHLAASERLALAFERGEPFLDPWVSEWSLGYPVWRSYQPLPHIVGALWLKFTRPFFPDAFHAFAALQYLLIAALPCSFYAGARLLGLSPLAAGLFAMLSLAPSSAGDMGRYGLSYGATCWRGSGLYTQVLALHFLLPTLGLLSRALEGQIGRRGQLGISVLLALTSLSHIVFGYVAFVSAALLACVAIGKEAPGRIARLAHIVLPALGLLAWFVVPLLLSRHEVNHSRWEDVVKWDSHGWRFTLSELFKGNFFDAWRQPVLSLLVGLGVLLTWLRREQPVARRALAMMALWLVLFAGREAWGHLLLLVAMPGDLHIHRLQAAFEIGALLAAATGIAWGLEQSRRRSPALFGAAVLTLGAGLLYLGYDRARYLDQSTTWGRENLAAWDKDKGDIDAAIADVRQILAELPGRVSAGKAAEWGRDFKVGSLPMYTFTTRAHLDQVSFLYHSMSLTSDLMVHRNEEDLAHDVLFAVRAVLAPADRVLPPAFRRRAVHGRFAVYEASPEGYFGLVDVGSRYTGPASTWYEPSKGWLDSEHLRHGIVVALDAQHPAAAPGFARWQPIPPPDAAHLTPRGRIVRESKDGEVYRATYELQRECWALLKVTYHFDLRATVDGVPVAGLRVTPGFLAIPVGAGTHEVVVRYAPGPLRPALFAAGIALLGLLASGFVETGWLRLEQAIRAVAGWFLRPLSSPRARTTLLLIGLTLIAFRPLFRGRLISGHDATEYPPRLIEFARALKDGHIPPVWAADLGSGHGQPLFGFAPPLVYAAALPFHALGAKLADSLQFGLYLLHLLGAMAAYRIGRLLGGDRAVGRGVAAAWCFSPYVSLDLFVRTAFAEAAAVAVSPIAVWALLRALDRPGARRIALAAAAVALVPLGHNAAALLLFPALALVVLAAVSSRPAGQRQGTVLAGAAALAGGLGLSAWFWLPALAEKGYVKTELLRQDFLHWSHHSVVWWQLLWSKWGFGISAAGTDQDGMSFALGPIHLVLAAMSLVVVARSGRRAQLTGLAWAFAAAALFGAFLSTTAAGFLWQRVETLQYMAYPWRALGLPGLFLPLLALPALIHLGPRARIWTIAALIVFNLPHTEPKGYLTFDEEFYLPESIASHELKTSTREEYEPRWAIQPPRYTKERLTAAGVSLKVDVLEDRTGHERLSVEAPAPVRAETRTLYYPGFGITVDGIEVAIDPEPTRGTMLFALPAGRHEVLIRLQPTPLRRASGLFSWITAALILAGVLFARRDGLHADGGSAAAPPRE